MHTYQMLPIVLLLTSLSHSQQGKTECPIKVDASISKSYRVTGNCTFILGHGVVDAISISRTVWPPTAFGNISVNGVIHDEDSSASGHIEPFSIVPMWTTYNATDVYLTDPVHVQIPGEALVSFGMAEAPALIFGEVIPDSYDTREWVYDYWAASPWVMWVVHGCSLAAVLWVWARGSRSPGGRYTRVSNDSQVTQQFTQVDKFLLRWLAVSLVLDVVMWSIWAGVRISYASPGGIFIWVTVFRILMLGGLAWLLIRVDYVPESRWLQVIVAVVLPGYVAGMLYWGNIKGVICVALGTATMLVAYTWPPFALILVATLFGIVLNLGSGVLAPVCMYQWCSKVNPWAHVSVNMDDKKYELKDAWKATILKYNRICFALHLISASALFFLVRGNPEWPVCATTPHFSWVPALPEDEGKSCRDVACKVNVEYASVGRIPLEWLVFAFHMMSVFAHFFNMVSKKYTDWLDKRMNPGRWLEYFFSASIMQVVLLVMTGYTDVWLLSMSAVLMAITQVFGHTTEQYLYAVRESRTQPPYFAEKWQFFFAGVVSFSPPWVAIYYSLIWSIDNSDPGPPAFVKILLFLLVLTFGGFAFVMVYYIRNYRDDLVSYESERAYCILSILSKTLLTWQLYFGIFMRTERDLESYMPC